MAKMSRDKGARVEREIVNAHLEAGIHAEWRAVPGYEDYEVSEAGELRRRIRRGMRLPGSMLRGTLKHGYARYKLRRPDGSVKWEYAHRLVAWAFIGPAPTPEHQVAHFDGDRQNNHWRNLRWATCQENHFDRVRHGRGSGEQNNFAKTTRDVVLRIRADYDAGGVTFDQIAAKYGVSRSQAFNIARRRQWKHV